MDCPRCGAAMQEETFDGHHGRVVVIDICHPCQSFWFDSRESVALTPGSTLALFRIIGERAARPQPAGADLAKCPRCRGRLRRTRDMQRGTRFEYLRCPNEHGRLTTFFDFLREKNFIKPLTSKQIAELRTHVQTVSCSNCGSPIDLTRGTACAHCGSPLSVLDMEQAETLVAQLQRAEERAKRPIDPALPLELERARREVEIAFQGFERETTWFRDVSSAGLVGASLHAMVKWLKKSSG